MSKEIILDTIGSNISFAREKIYSVFMNYNPFYTSLLTRILLSTKWICFPKATNNYYEYKNFIPILFEPSTSIKYGLAGRFWSIKPNWQSFHSPKEFNEFKNPTYSKVYWTFSFSEISENKTKINWTTSVEHLSEESGKKFSNYWKYAQPLSLLIRKLLLIIIKRKIKLILRRN